MPVPTNAHALVWVSNQSHEVGSKRSAVELLFGGKQVFIDFRTKTVPRIVQSTADVFFDEPGDSAVFSAKFNDPGLSLSSITWKTSADNVHVANVHETTGGIEGEIVWSGGKLPARIILAPYMENQPLNPLLFNLRVKGSVEIFPKRIFLTTQSEKIRFFVKGDLDGFGDGLIVDGQKVDADIVRRQMIDGGDFLLYNVCPTPLIAACSLNCTWEAGEWECRNALKTPAGDHIYQVGAYPGSLNKQATLFQDAGPGNPGFGTDIWEHQCYEKGPCGCVNMFGSMECDKGQEFPPEIEFYEVTFELCP